MHAGWGSRLGLIGDHRRAPAPLLGLLLAVLLLATVFATPASADVTFTRAWGWGVSDRASQFEACTSTCRAGLSGGGVGQLASPGGLAADRSGDVYVADNGNSRVDEFSSAGGFIRAWGWGVSDGTYKFEICTSTCRAGENGQGPGGLLSPNAVAVDSSGDVYVTDGSLHRVDEFSPTGSFVRAWGWGVSDGARHLEVCTSTCIGGQGGGGAGEMFVPDGVALDGSGDVYVADNNNERVDEFSSTGSFIRAWGWGVSDGADHLETCTSTCRSGFSGQGTGQLHGPDAIATDSSGNVYVAESFTDRVDEFSSTGSFIKAWGWGVSDGSQQFQTCSSSCTGAHAGWNGGEFSGPDGVATDSSDNVYVVNYYNAQVTEVSSTGSFIRQWGWGVSDGMNHFETCTSACISGPGGSGAGELATPTGVATATSGHLYVSELGNDRLDEFNLVRRTTPASAVPTPQHLPLSLPALGAALLLAGLLIQLVAFPAELFNKTYEENEGEIHRILARLGWRYRRFPPRVGLLLFVVVGGVLVVWLALGEGAEGHPLAVAIGLFFALPIVTFAFRIPSELYYRRRSGVSGSLQVFPAALLVAVASAALSRLLHLQPAYLYGVFAGYAAVRTRRLSRSQEGAGALLGALVLGSVALLCWWGWGALNVGAHAPNRGALSNILFWTFALAAEGLVFALVPLRFLDGAALRRWHFPAWLIPQLAAIVFFAYVLILHGRTEKIDAVQQLIKPIVFFVAFGLVSFAFWGYFRWDGRPTGRMPPKSATEPKA